MNIQLNKYRINIHDLMSFTIKVNTLPFRVHLSYSILLFFLSPFDLNRVLVILLIS